MKLKPKHIETFCLWWGLSLGEKVDYTLFFHSAFKWKFGTVDEKQLRFVCYAYYRSGYIPEFAQEYWNQRVLQFIRLKGGAV